MAEATPTIPTLQGRYRIEAKVGTGRLADVYRAFDDQLQRPVLVHMLRKDLMQQEPLKRRFAEEISASARRSHQSLLEVYESGAISGRPYMITEYVAGRTIRELGQLTPEDALLYFRQVVGAVATCQRAGMPHPPISSSNLILVDDGHVELVESWLTPANAVAADIAAYRPPERTEGAAVTPAGAVYSLGLLLWEMLVGKRPVTGTDPHTIAKAHLTTTIPPLSQARPSVQLPALETLIQQMTARDPAQRPTSALVLARDLDALRKKLGGNTQKLAAPPVKREGMRQQVRKRLSETAQAVSPQRTQRTQRTERQPAPQRPAPQTAAPAVAPAAPHDDDRPQRSRASYTDGARTILGLVVMLSLFAAVSIGTYTVARRFAADIIGAAPLTGGNASNGNGAPPSLFNRGQVLVTTTELNLRETPATNGNVLVVMPGGLTVRYNGEAAQADNIQWWRVTTTVGGQDYTGWASSRYLREP